MSAYIRIKERVVSLITSHAIKSAAVGVSGGPDSMLLLNLLYEIMGNQSLVVVHVNYKKRGSDSDLDEKLVIEECKKMNINYSVRDAKELSDKGNFQENAREFRFKACSEIKNLYDLDTIVYAHHQDDLIETWFQKLLRGSDMNLWEGFSDSEIFRPLLQTSHHEIMEALEERKIPYRIDTSNYELDYQRNKIRHSLIPVFEELSDSYRTQIIHLIKLASGHAEISDAVLSDLLVAESLNRDNLFKFSDEAQMILIKKWIQVQSGLALTKHQIGNLINSLRDLQTGRGLQLTDRYSVVRDRDKLTINGTSNRKQENEFTVHISELPLKKEGLYFSLGVYRGEKENRNRLFVSLESGNVTFRVRQWQDGDRIIPFGMKGSKKVKSLLTDLKVDATKKREALVLIDLNGEIAALILPENIDGKFAILSDVYSCKKFDKTLIISRIV